MTRFIESPLAAAQGFLLALAMGLLIGRTREPAPNEPPRPGMRDFLIIAASGAACAFLDQIPITAIAFVAISAVLVVMRLEHSERAGITTELAALLTFVIGYMELTSSAMIASALGLTIALILTIRDRLRSFARDVISDREYLDTLAFLSLIFIILPILPSGGYGPFGFFEPRKIWTFVILVSGVSYLGYFFTKFLGPESGVLMTAVVGGLASSTAYTSDASRVVEESPESAVAMARATLIANTILFPRLMILALVISPALGLAAIPSLTIMMLAGAAAVLLLTRAAASERHPGLASREGNPFALRPALKYGVAFTAVLFVVQLGKRFFGGGGQLISSAIGGLIDVDAVTVGLAQFYGSGTSTLTAAVIGMALGAAANAVFKFGIAIASHSPAFWWRVGAGFVVMFAAGGAFLWFVGVPPIQIPG